MSPIDIQLRILYEVVPRLRQENLNHLADEVVENLLGHRALGVTDETEDDLYLAMSQILQRLIVSILQHSEHPVLVEYVRMRWKELTVPGPRGPGT